MAGGFVVRRRAPDCIHQPGPVTGEALNNLRCVMERHYRHFVIGLEPVERFGGCAPNILAEWIQATPSIYEE
jgi:hypothetical protein